MILHVEGLSKRYGELRAVDNLTFSLERGERFGLLGPNGAGKTTTISMLVGALKPTSGRVLLDGKPLGGETDPARKKIGYVPQELALHQDLSALDNLKFFGALYGLHGVVLEKRTDAALDLVGLRERQKSRVSEFSGGMKRRLNLAAALLHEPELLILDEPTVGVDPQSRNAIFENLETLLREGTTLLYTTHYMEEVERLCDKIAIVDHGKLVVQGSLSQLKESVARTGTRLKVTLERGQYLDEATRKALGIPVELFDGGFVASLAHTHEDTEKLLGVLRVHGLSVCALATDEPDLEDVFLELTGTSLRDE
jgi:ABC-2 type transport system ATP-binding protein